MRQSAQAKPSRMTDEDNAVRAWRVSQLTRLGLSATLADMIADTIDWHDVARLVQAGCPASLAVTILN